MSGGKPIHLQWKLAEAEIYVQAAVFQIAINTPQRKCFAFRLYVQTYNETLNIQSSLVIIWDAQNAIYQMRKLV